MKAWMDTQIMIDLDDNEIRRLRTETLTGIVNVQSYDRKLPDRYLEIVIGGLVEEKNYCIEMENIPKGANYDNTTGYIIRVSEESYNNLLKHGRIVERPWLGGKVTITRMRYQNGKIVYEIPEKPVGIEPQPLNTPLKSLFLWVE